MDLDKFILKFGGLTEEYTFYNGEVSLRYDVKKHEYLLVTDTGLRVVEGVSTVSHIVDKSFILMPWSCKVMAEKIYKDYFPTYDPDGQNPSTRRIAYTDFQKIVGEAKNAHKDRLADAGMVGNIAHDWIEKYIKLQLKLAEYYKKEGMTGGPVVDELDEHLKALHLLDPRATSCCKAALDWMKKHKVKWVSTEQKLYSREDEYAGTGDGFAYCSSCDDSHCCKIFFIDELANIDWKSSNYLYDEYRLQTAAYVKAYNEEYGTCIKKRWINRLDKETAEFESWYLDEDDYEIDFKAFKSALQLTRDIEAVQAKREGVSKAKSMVLKQEKVEKKEKAIAEGMVLKQIKKANKELLKQQKEQNKKKEMAERKAAKKAATIVRNEEKKLHLKAIKEQKRLTKFKLADILNK